MTDALAKTAAARVSAALARRWYSIGVAICTAAAAGFLAFQLDAWPPHEDEALALFTGRLPLPDLLVAVLDERGGAPLHFLFAWVVVHVGGGLTALRLVSAAFAVASVPLTAALACRLAGRSAALVATALAAASWMLLFHGVYGRMYSVFLAASVASFLAFLSALGHGGRKRWALWAAAVLLTVAAHPYGALVLAAQGVYALATRQRLREGAWAFAAVLVLGIPFWRSDVVLRGRFEIGVGVGGSRLGSPLDVLRYLARTAGDVVSGEPLAVAGVLALAGFGALRLARERASDALLVGAVLATPAAALMLVQFGDAAVPESRHLIFVLPFFLTLVGAGIVGVGAAAGRPSVGVAAALTLALVYLEVAWGWQRTPDLYRGEPAARVAARAAAARWLAATSRPGDVLFGYDPLFLQAWELGGDLSPEVVPRADARLALRRCWRPSPSVAASGCWMRATPPAGRSRSPYACRTRRRASRRGPSGRFSSCARRGRRKALAPTWNARARCSCSAERSASAPRQRASPRCSTPAGG